MVRKLPILPNVDGLADERTHLLVRDLLGRAESVLADVDHDPPIDVPCQSNLPLGDLGLFRQPFLKKRIDLLDQTEWIAGGVSHR
jgi:hypothetical protein